MKWISTLMALLATLVLTLPARAASTTTTQIIANNTACEGPATTTVKLAYGPTTAICGLTHIEGPLWKSNAGLTAWGVDGDGYHGLLSLTVTAPDCGDYVRFDITCDPWTNYPLGVPSWGVDVNSTTTVSSTTQTHTYAGPGIDVDVPLIIQGSFDSYPDFFWLDNGASSSSNIQMGYVSEGSPLMRIGVMGFTWSPQSGCPNTVYRHNTPLSTSPPGGTCYFVASGQDSACGGVWPCDWAWAGTLSGNYCGEATSNTGTPITTGVCSGTSGYGTSFAFIDAITGPWNSFRGENSYADITQATSTSPPVITVWSPASYPTPTVGMTVLEHSLTN